MRLLNKLTLRAKLYVYVLVTLVASLLIVGLILQGRIRSMASSKAKELTISSAQGLATGALLELERFLGFTRSVASWVNGAEKLDTLMNPTIISQILTSHLESNPEIASIWIDLSGLDSPFSNTVGIIQAERTPLGITIVTSDWNPANEYLMSGYAQAKRLKQSILIEPYFKAFDGATKVLISGISVPTASGGQVGVTFPISSISQKLELSKPFPTSELALVSSNGTVIAHTNSFYVGRVFRELNPELEAEHFLSDRLSRGVSHSFSWSADDGTKHISAAVPVSLGTSSQNWGLMLSTPQSNLVSGRLILVVVLIGLILTLSITGIVLHFTGLNLTKPLRRINSVIDGLAQGDIDRNKKIEISSGDEMEEVAASLNRLIDGLNETESFAREIGKGNLDTNFRVHGNKDLLGQSLLEMQKSLKHAKEYEADRMAEEKKQSWATHGIAMFSEILRQNNDNLNELSFGIIQNLVKYTESNQGGVFVVNEKDNEKPTLEMTACYAYDRRKFMQNTIEIGEGLVGRCFIEGKTILMTDVPDDYIKITSGLGLSRPRCLLIVPLTMNNVVLGVIEIASFRAYEKHQIDFVERIAESIASTISTVRINIRTNELLAKSQQQAEEMTAQEEEMRQNMEELQATNEQVEQLKLNIELQQRMILAVLNEVPEKIFLKDDKGRYLIANKPVAENYGIKPEELIGKSDFDFYPEEEAKAYFLKEQEIIKEGKPLSFEEGDPSKYDGLIVRSLKKPFFIEHLGVTGLIGVQFDISEIKRKEFQAQIMANEIAEQQKDLEKVTESLQKEMALMNALMMNIPDAIYFKDMESRFIRTSHNMAANFRVNSTEELYGKCDFDFFTEEHARPAFEDEQEIIRTGIPIIDKIEKETYEDGRPDTYVSTTKMPLRDSNGNIIGTFGISKDVTKIMERESQARRMAEELSQKKTELEKITESMKREMALSDALMENIPDAIYFKDLESKFIRYSHNMIKKHNLKKVEEMLGKSDFDFFGEEHARPAYEDEQEIIRTGIPIIDKIERETYDDGRPDSYVSTTKMPLKDKEGNTIGTFGISRDVSKIKHLEKKANDMISQTENIQHIIRGIAVRTPVLIYKLSSSNAIEEITGAGLKLMGVKEQDLIGKLFTDIFPAATKGLQQGVKDALVFTHKGKGWEMEHEVFPDKSREGLLLGYAYRVGLV